MSRNWQRASALALCGLLCLLTGAAETQGNSNNNRAGTRHGAVGAYILGPRALVAGSEASYRVAVHLAPAPGLAEPLQGAWVRLALKHKGQTLPLARGLSDASGNARFRFRVPDLPTADYPLQVRVAAGARSTIRETRVRVFPGGRLLLTTDKALYQPSQTIHVRALALRSVDLRPVAGQPITIRVRDPKDNLVFSQESKTSRFGVASLDFTLADEINLGRYAVEARVKGAGPGGWSQHRVEVKRYVLPRFKVGVETERAYYRPGETVRGTVRARYFFGKPVAGGRLSLDIRSKLGGRVTLYRVPEHALDAAGRATFEVKLVRDAGAELGELRVLARVKDLAGRRHAADRSLPLTSRPLRLGLVAENSRLVPGVRNRLHVLAGYPDGQPAAGARVRLQRGNQMLEARTDALGVASFRVLPLRDRRGREGQPGRMALRVSARDRGGQRGALRTSLPVAAREAVLVRPASSLVGPGGTLVATLLAGPARRAATGDRVYMDVVKDGQTLATHAATLRRGQARVRFRTDHSLFGLLELRGYRLARSGERVGTSRMVYVDQPGKLKITARPDRPVYRPGQRARISFSVVDSRTGDGVQAALGLLAVDQAVLALGGLKSDSPRIFFTLASQVQGAIQDLRARPGGRGLAQWIGDGVRDAPSAARRERAADVLLGAVAPPDGELWETNPWKERREAWARQAPRLIAAARGFVSTHSVGRLTRGGWRFQPELVPWMADSGVIPAELKRDPWRRTVRPWHLRRTDRSFSFSTIAARVAPQKLERIYAALGQVWQQLKLRREPVKGLKRKQWPLVLPRDLPARLVRAGKLKRQQVSDPWGRPFRVRRRARTFVNPYHSGLISRYIIYSPGPDLEAGTSDDITPPGPRVVSAVFGRDAALGRDAADALGALIGDEIGEAHGVGGLGLAGFGRGGGGTGAGTIGLGTLGSIGKGGGPGMQARVRSRFPETLLWRPELITDRAGRATLELELADSITSWRLAATGSTTSGLLGSTQIDLRVFQDFFVDLDLPGAMTQGDRLSVPVTVYNYLKRKQTVTLRLRREQWFSPAGPLQQTIELGPSGVGVRHFPIVARRVGRGELTVQARASGGLADAVRRGTRVEPDGVEHAVSHSGTLGAESGHRLRIPAAAIPGTPRVSLAIYAGPLSQTQEGLEGMLRMPGGCFEQTSSSTYPNLLVLDYLRRTGGATPAVEKKARAYINAGYQRLISFEVEGGGFSWFGDAPANQILTAYGLMEFFDMARVHPVDPALIKRTQRWLVAQQRGDGSWAPDRRVILDGAANAYTRDRLRITAYIANVLRRTRFQGPALKRAQRWVRRHAARARDPYTLAVLGNLMAPDSDATARRVRQRLWGLRRESKQGLAFDGPGSSLTHGAGLSGKLESTALAALAFLGSDSPPAQTGRVLDTLVANKDSFGSWHSTQATILSLQALLLQHRKSHSRPHGTVQVLVDGRRRGTVTLRAGQDVAHRLDLTPHAGQGDHRVALRFSGKGNLQYQLVGRYWLPRERQVPRATGSLSITTRFDRQKLRQGQPLWLAVDVRNRGRQGVDMPLVSLALPPGFSVDEQALTGLVGQGKVSKVQRVGNRALLYLTRLEAGQSLRFRVSLRGRYPLRVQARPSVVYEYYRPENRAQSQPRVLQVM